MNIIVNKSFINIIIVIVTIMEYNPFFGTVINFYKIIFLFVLLIVAQNRNILIIEKKIVLILVSVYLLIILQGFIYGGFSYAAIYFPLITFYVPYLVIKILKKDFFKIYIKTIFYISVFTFPFWFLQSTVPQIDTFLRMAANDIFSYSWSSSPRTILFYTPAWADFLKNDDLGIFRNSGLFHEPGAFGVFLVIALSFNLLINKVFVTKENIVFIFFIFTTLSTTAYIVFFVITLIYILTKKYNPFIKVGYSITFLIIFLGIFESQDFLANKVENQFQEQTYAAQFDLGVYGGHSGRFYATIISIDNFISSPFIGREILSATSLKKTGFMHQDSSYSYGVTGFFATYGVFFGLFYFIYFYAGIKKLSLSDKSPIWISGVFFAINLSLLTQTFITSMIVVAIFMFGILSNNSKAN